MLRKIWNIAKGIFLVLGIVFILLLFLYAILSKLPKSTTAVDVSLDMVKLDELGNEIGTFPVTIKGEIKEYWFHEDQLDVIISPFESYTEFEPGNSNGLPGGVFDMHSMLHTVYHGKGPDGNEAFAVYFSKDLKYWAFVVTKYTEDNPFYSSARYVASTNSNDTVMDLKNYFDGLLKIEHPILKTDPALDWQMHGAFIHADGTQQAMDLTIAGNIWDYRNKDFYKLDLQIAFSDSFTYEIPTPTAGFACIKYNNKNTPDLYICSAVSVNKEKPFPKDPITTHFAIDVEKEYFIVIFKDAPECYFVASTDDTTSEEILLHFQDFVEKYKAHFW